MRSISLNRIEWDEDGKDRLVWKYPEKHVAWNSKLIVREDQAAALLIGRELFSKSLKMLDFFAQAGEYVISPKVIPLLTTESPEVISREYISCIVVYCSTKEHTYSCKIHTGDCLGQAYVHAEAEMQCKFKIIQANKFLKDVVASHKKTSNDKALGFLDRYLGDELFRQHPPFNWPPKQNIPIDEILKQIGIELRSLRFDRYNQHGGGVSA